MSTPEKKPVSLVRLALNLVAVLAFFTFFYRALQPHVPSSDPKMIRLWAALAASCMSGVFWLALQMVQAVYHFQRSRAKQ